MDCVIACPFPPGALTGIQAQSLDIKLDDGLPGKGRIIGATSTADCATEDGTHPATAKYQNNETSRCPIWFTRAF